MILFTIAPRKKRLFKKNKKRNFCIYTFPKPDTGQLIKEVFESGYKVAEEQARQNA